MLKKLALAGSGLTFSVIALLTIFIPETVARTYGYTIARTDVDAMNELRAVYIGFWIGLGVLFFTALKNPTVAKIGGTMLLLQASGRVLSIAADGMPSAPFIAAMIAELISGAIILWPERELHHARAA